MYYLLLATKIQIKNELYNNPLDYFFGQKCQTPEEADLDKKTAIALGVDPIVANKLIPPRQNKK